MEAVVNKEFLENSYSGKRVLITGHTGFKGTWLSLWLKELGAVIRGYALAPENERCIFNVTAPYSPADSIIADIRDRQRLSEVIRSFQPHFIFHLAAQPLVRRSYEIPAETFEVNAVGTANLLEAVQSIDGKATTVIVTTDKVYENQEQQLLYREDAVLGGYDPYSASKACTELVTASFRNSFFNVAKYAYHQKAITSARAGNVIGGGDFSKDRIIPDIIAALQTNKEIQVRNPASVRPWQHVLEPLGGYLLLAAKTDNDIRYSGAYNFGPEPEDHLTVQQLAEEAIRAWGKGSWAYTGDKNAPHEAGLLQLNIEKAKTRLHWVPKLNAREAIEWTISWYRTPETAVKDFTLQQIKNYMAL